MTDEYEYVGIDSSDNKEFAVMALGTSALLANAIVARVIADASVPHTVKETLLMESTFVDDDGMPQHTGETTVDLIHTTDPLWGALVNAHSVIGEPLRKALMETLARFPPPGYGEAHEQQPDR